MAKTPDGDRPPIDGRLPAAAALGAERRGFSVYLHVPFCRVRCGYCDFNTYTASELRGARQDAYADEAIREIHLAQSVLSDLGKEASGRSVSTMFLGGGTPTLLPADDLVRMLDAVRDTWGFADDVEVTTEANPDSVDAADLQRLANAGFTRVSFGMQSAVPSVLATLDRTHDPARVPQVVEWAKDAGLEVSLDLIYGTPGETLADWRRSLDAVLAADVGHVSAYALIVEEGTALARRIVRGELPAPDDDVQAAMYEMADASFGGAGYDWYEVSNWARDGKVARHNLAYWRGDDWWGIGPGAHSHIGGVRWWNVKHPAAYAQRLAVGESPAQARETLDDDTRRVERILLETRIVDGLPLDVLDKPAREAVAGLIAEQLIEPQAAFQGRIVPTLRGRLLADTIVRRLTD